MLVAILTTSKKRLSALVHTRYGGGSCLFRIQPYLDYGEQDQVWSNTFMKQKKSMSDSP